MTRNIVFVIILFALFSKPEICCLAQTWSFVSVSNKIEQDTMKNRQLLYNGISWTNRYHRIEGDQFLFSPLFMPGTVSMNGKTFKNVRIKYDVFSDEIITPLNMEDILQVNKEMVDSFSIYFEDKLYRFTNIRNDTLKELTGYVNILYNGNTPFYVKYKKSISPSSSPKSDGHFIQNHMMFLVKDNQVYNINGTRTIFRVLNADIDQIRNFIKKNKLKISKKIPESFVPVIMFYDSIQQ